MPFNTSTVSASDYDLDGDLDVFLGGDVIHGKYPLSYKSRLLENINGILTEVTSESIDGLAGLGVVKDAVFSDYDNDGDMDVAISHVDLIASASLLRNDGGNKKNWIGLSLKGELGLASGIGAKITIRTGDKTQVMVNQWTSGYLSNKEPRVHVGLGDHAIIDELTIQWPDGSKEVFKQVPINQYLSFIKGKGQE